MQIKNFFKMNDWDIKSFLIVVFSIQLAYLGAVGLDKLDIQIPFLRQVLGFIYLTFVPGYLLLRIFKIHNLSSEESFLYAVGLSLFFDMFIGFLMNMLYPLIGVTDKPISEVPILGTFTSATLLLSILAYFRDKDYHALDSIDLKDIFSTQFLFLNLIPFVAIFGVYLVNYYFNNIGLMIMIVVIAFLFILQSVIRIKYPAYSIWVVGLSFILSNTLITPYILIKDVWGEYIVAETIISRGRWDISFAHPYNTVMSVTILTPIIYIFCDFSLTWIYKVVFPLYLSVVPLSIYIISQKILKSKDLAVFSSLLFILVFPYFNDIPFITKQLVAEIFLGGIYLLLLNSKINKYHKKIMLLLFGTCLIVSHYGVAYITGAMLLFLLFSFKLSTKLHPLAQRANVSEIYHFAIVYNVSLIIWYLYIGKSSSFVQIISIARDVWDLLYIGLFSPEYARAMYYVTKEVPNLLWVIYKLIFVVIIIFAVVGILYSLFTSFFKKMYNEFQMIACSLVGIYYLIILISSITLPKFSAMNPYRLYHLGLFMLAPFCLVGLILIMKSIIKIKNNISHLRVGAIFCIIVMLFNTQFIFEVFRADPLPSPISLNSAKASDNIEIKGRVYLKYIQTQDVFSAKWLSKYGQIEKKVYAAYGWGQGLAILKTYGKVKNSIEWFPNDFSKIEDKAYIYLFYVNVIEKIVYNVNKKLGIVEFKNFNINYFNDDIRIYNNNGSYILVKSAHILKT